MFRTNFSVHIMRDGQCKICHGEIYRMQQTFFLSSTMIREAVVQLWYL